MAFEARKHPARVRKRSRKTHSKHLELEHRKQHQLVVIGDHSFDVEDAPAPQSPCISTAEAKQNPVNSKLGHRKQSQIVVIGNRSFDVEDAPAPQSPCISTAEAKQNPVTQSAEAIIHSPRDVGGDTWCCRFQV
jgi:hypothetical protein